MEFGIFLNGYIPGPAAHDRVGAHELMRETEYMVFADKHNWKYAWFGEHHALTEYSHMSAPEVVMGYVAAQTDYIHLGSGINNLSPRKEHPVRYAERAAMLDHFTKNRFEWGTGRGAGSHELASFNIMTRTRRRPNGTKSCGRSPACGSRSTTRTKASTSPCRRPTTSCRSRTARVIRRSGSRAATRRRSKAGGTASVRSRSTSSRSTTCGPDRGVQGGGRGVHRARR